MFLPLISKLRSRSSRNRVSRWNFSIWSVFFLLSWRSRSLSSPALTSFWLASLWLMARLSTCLWSLWVKKIYLLERYLLILNKQVPYIIYLQHFKPAWISIFMNIDVLSWCYACSSIVTEQYITWVDHKYQCMYLIHVHAFENNVFKIQNRIQDIVDFLTVFL